MRDIAREQLLDELLALRPELERQGVTGLALFGSRARRDNRPDSDVDLVLEVADSTRFSLIDLAGIYNLIEERLGLESSLLIRRGLNDSFKRTVARDQVVVF